MRVGDVLNGYEIVTPPTNSGGGMSQWSRATKGGQTFFVKMFLSPKYPLDTAPGGPEAKANKRSVCLAFESRHLEIGRRIDPSQPGSGNLVVPCDFFRVEATYVKVMPWVDGAPVPPAWKLTSKQLIVFLRSLAFSLRMLHGQRIVHGDVKADNVLALRTGSDLYVAKLIDFDEAYVVGDPPRPEHIVGDPGYYSPELLRYIKRDDRLPADALSTASDVFSLGIYLHVLFTGRRPDFDADGISYPAEALLVRRPLDVSAAPSALQPLLARMLALVPSARPDVDELIAFLQEIDPDALVASGPAGPPPARVAASSTSSPTPAPASAGARSAAAGPALASGGLRSTMGRRPSREETR